MNYRDHQLIFMKRFENRSGVSTKRAPGPPLPYLPAPKGQCADARGSLHVVRVTCAREGQMCNWMASYKRFRAW